jgi:hypothetical protein
MAEECGSLGQSSRRALGSSWCSPSSFCIHPDLGAIIAKQFLQVDTSAHLVLDVKGKNVRVVSFDMHLLDSRMGRGDSVTGGVEKRRRRERREGRKSGDVAGRGC